MANKDRYNLSERLKGTQAAKKYESANARPSEEKKEYDFGNDPYNLRSRLAAREKTASEIKAGANPRKAYASNLIQSIEDRLYKPGATSDSVLEGLKDRAEKFGDKMVWILREYNKNPEKFGEDYKKYSQFETDTKSATDRYLSLARARTGDKSVLDGATGDQYNEYERLLRLSGYDQTGKNLLAQNNIKDFDVLAERSKDFDLENAMLTVEDYYRMINTPVMGDGMSGARVNVADYEKAADDIESFTGINVRNLTPDQVQGVLEEVGANGEYVGYLQDYLKREQAAKDEEAARNKWRQDFSANWNSIRTAPDYKTLSHAGAKNESFLANNEYADKDYIHPSEVYPAQAFPEVASGVFDFMTEEELRDFTYLYQQPGEGGEQARAYINDLAPELLRRRAEKQTQDATEFAEKNAFTGVLSFLGARAGNALNSIVGAVDMLATPFAATAGIVDPSAMESDPNDIQYDFARYVQALEKANMQNIADATEGLNIAGINIPSQLYSGLGSITDSFLSGALLGPQGASAALSAGAYNTARYEGADRLDAGVTAAFEGLTEKYSLDALLDGSGSAAKKILQNMLVEPTEELANMALNLGWDSLRYGEDGEVGTRFSELRTMGYSPYDASIQIAKEYGKEALATVISSAFAGAVGGAGGAAVNAAADNKAGGNLRSNNAVKPMLDLAATLDLPEDVKAIVQEQQKAAGAGENISTAKIGRIFREMMKAVDERTQNAIQTTASRYINDLLEARGKKDSGLAQAISRIVADNGTATPEDYQTVAKDDDALAVAEGLVKAYDKDMDIAMQAEDVALKATTKADVSAQAVESGVENANVDAEVALQTVQEAAAELGGNAESMVSAYNEGQDPAVYTEQFKRAYQYGEAGYNLGVISKSQNLSGLTEQQVSIAYMLGKGVREGRNQQAAQQPKGRVAVGNVDTSKIRGMKLNEAQRKSVGAITVLAKAVGFNVEFTARSYGADGKAISRQNGSWRKSTRTLTIDINAGRISRTSANYAIMQTVGHELTHFIKDFADADLWNAYQDFVFGHLSEKMTDDALEVKIADVIKRYSNENKQLDRDGAIEEIVADASGDALSKLTDADLQKIAEDNPSLLKKIGNFIQRWVSNVKKLIEQAYAGQKARNEFAEQMVDVVDELGRKWAELLQNAAQHARMVEGEDVAVNAQDEVKLSLQENERLMQNAIAMNEQKGNVDAYDLQAAADARAEVAAFMRDDSRTLNLPEDLMGNTFFSDAAYGGSEENTTVCPRSIGADAFLDAVSDKIGRPLTVAEQVRISQDVIGAADIKEPQCIYCYVAADRAAYREFLGKYIDQRDSVIDALKKGETDTDALYETFLNGRKDTPNMKKRFKLWVDSYRAGKRMLSASDLSNIGVLTSIQSDKYKQLSGDANFAAQMKDALAYAQSASWAKKRVNYVAYNGHILKWTQNRINKLNSMYGLRMYSFSDFSPAFALENMQMVTDAAVRGLKMLAYTKVPAFAEIFANTGMNINVSVFATEVKGDNGSSIVENNLMGADWKAAQKLRSEHENIGVTFVATSDAQVEWALAQDWIDVVIPYHLVRTGRTIAEMMKYKNYTAESGDTKKPNWSKASGNLSSIPAALHNNDRDTYMRLLEENNLEPRFARFVDNPNYMKLVNETRQSVTTSKPVQPIFNTDAAINALQDMANNGGYYVPVGGSEQRMYELADEFAGRVQAGEYKSDISEADDTKYSIEEDTEGRKVVVVEEDILKGIYSGGKWTDDQRTAAKKAVSDAIKSATVRNVDGVPVHVNSQTRRKFGGGNSDGRIRSKKPELFADKLRTASETSNIILATVDWKRDGELKHDRKDNFVDFARGNVYVSISGRGYVAETLTGITDRGRYVLYDIQSLEPVDIKLKKEDAHPTAVANAESYVYGASSTEDIVTHSSEDDKSQIQDPNQITDRELLANVMDAAAENEAELDFVRRYRTKIDELNKKQAELDATNEAIVNARKEGKKSELGALRSKAEILGKQLDRLDGKLLTFEAGKPLQAVVKRERAKLRQKTNERVQKRVAEVREQEAKRRDRIYERMDELRAEKNRKIDELRKEKTEAVKKVRDEKNESFARQKYLDEVKKSADQLRVMVTTPTNKKHVPQVLRQPLADFLTALDFTSARQLDGGAATNADKTLEAAMLKMKDALNRIKNHQNGLDTTGAEYFSGYLDLPAGYAETFDEIIGKVRTAIRASDGINGTPINRMKSADLHELAKHLRMLHSAINNMNSLIANAKYASAIAASQDTIKDLDKVKRTKDQNALVQKLSDFIDWKNTVPYYAFKRFGEGGKAIFEALMDGWDKLAFNAQELVDFTKKAYKPEEVKAWESEIKTIELESGESVRMTAAQLMSLYCLAKREQALGHLMGGGIRIADIEGKRGKRIAQGENYILTEADIETFRDALNERQRAVADALQQDMVKRGGDWGNAISMRRFGYDMFTEENYFPVESDRNNMNAKDENATENSLLRLLNMSATKDLTKGANNAIVVRSIFDVYTAHMSDMAKYNALGLQILDLMKWLNYVERTDELDANGNSTGKITTQSVQKSLELAYGTEARKYIMEFIKNLNGEVEAGREDGIINKMTSNYKIAAVGANLRVGFLQITSLPRAATVIDTKYLLKGIAKWNAKRGDTSKQATAKVGIAKWKSMGFYDTNISRNMRQMIKHDETAIEKVREGSMKLAELGDAWTMGVLYGAVESELMQKERNLAPGTDAWNKRVNERMREIIYRTQVVDSTMTRSHLMRQKGAISGALAFMSEPTLTLNMMNDALFESRMSMRRGEKWNPAVAKNVAKVLAVSAVVSGLAAFMEAAFTAMRDDDEFETLAEKYLAALRGDYGDAETYGEKLNAFFGSALGGKLNPLANVPVISDLMDVWKNGADEQMWQAFMGEMGEGFRALMKVLREGGTLADYYRAAYKTLGGISKGSGIPASNAVRDLASIYNTFAAEPMGWKRIQTYDNTKKEAAEAYYAAIVKGDSNRAGFILERAEISGLSAADVADATATLIKEDYIGGRISESEARQYLSKYAKRSTDKIDTNMRDWGYQRNTGLKYSDMKRDYLDGLITKSQAQTLLMQYRGYDSEEVYWQLSKWDYEKATGEEGGKYSWFLDAVDAGYGYEKYAQELLNRGVDKSDIASAIASAYKSAYLEIKGTAEGDRMLEYLLDVYESIGYDREYERDYIAKKWK